MDAHSIPAFLEGQSRLGPPHMYVDEPTAREWVAMKIAKWTTKRGRSITLLARKIIKLRDRSCSWSHRLMELVAQGNYTACKMLEAIKPHICVSLGEIGGFDYEVAMDVNPDDLLEELYLGDTAA